MARGLRRMRRRARRDGSCSFGTAEHADLRLLGLEEDEDGSNAEIAIFGERIACRIGMPGRHIAMNMLAVLGAVQALGADVAKAAAALATLAPPQGRGARLTLAVAGGEATLIDESYNANPASMRAMLANLGRIAPGKGGRRVVVLGDMRELGPDSPRFHAELARADRGGVDRRGPCLRALDAASATKLFRKAAKAVMRRAPPSSSPWWSKPCGRATSSPSRGRSAAAWAASFRPSAPATGRRKEK